MGFDLNKEKWGDGTDPDDKKRDKMLNCFTIITITSVAISAGSFVWIMISDYDYTWVYILAITALILVIWGASSIRQIHEWRQSGGHRRPPWPFR